MNYKRNYGYGGHGKDRYSGSGGPSRADTSSLFGEVPDVMGIKTAFDSRRLDRNSIQPHFDKVVNDAKNFIRWGPDRRLASAVTVAAYLRAQGLKTNQVRKILEMARTTELKVKRGDLDIKNDIVKMRYLLAYTVGKATGQPKYPLEAFHSVLDPMLEVLMENPTEEGFEKFYDFLQAVVAYHRFFGGRE